MQQAKQIAEDLLQWIKALGFDRHKLIIQVYRRLMHTSVCAHKLQQIRPVPLATWLCTSRPLCSYLICPVWASGVFSL